MRVTHIDTPEGTQEYCGFTAGTMSEYLLVVRNVPSLDGEVEDWWELDEPPNLAFWDEFKAYYKHLLGEEFRPMMNYYELSQP